MRVLHISNNLDRGGAERLLLDMLPRMRQAGIEVTLYLLALHDKTIYNELVARGVPVITGSAASLYSPQHIAAVRSIIREQAVAIVHAHLFPSMFWASCAVLTLPHIHLMATEHNTWNRRRRAWFWPLDRFMYQRYQRIACISDQVSAALVEWLPSTVRQVCVVENGIDLTRFHSTHAPLAAAGGPIVIGVGRMTRQKAFHVLIRAAVLVPAARFWLVGDGPLRAQLQALVHSLNLTDRVKLLGRRNDVPELLKQATIYVQSSAWEGFGIAAVEAMAAGLPVIASDVAGLREVVGEAGLFFPAGSRDELACKLNRLLSDPQLQQILRVRGRARASQFKIARTVDSYLAIYNEYFCLRAIERKLGANAG